MKLRTWTSPPRVSWWADGELPAKGVKWGGSDRQFGTLREAINFVKTVLDEGARRTARIDFDLPPYYLDFADLEMRDRAAGLGLDLG